MNMNNFMNKRCNPDPELSGFANTNKFVRDPDCDKVTRIWKVACEDKTSGSGDHGNKNDTYGNNKTLTNSETLTNDTANTNDTTANTDML